MILLVGAGVMAKDCSLVLEDLGLDYLVVCNRESSAVSFSKETGANCLYGALKV